MRYERQYHTASVLTNGKVLVTGGYHRSTIENSAELYDLSTGRWTIIDSMMMHDIIIKHCY